MFFWHDIEQERLPDPKHRDCSAIAKCKLHFQNLALPFLRQYPEYARGEELPLMAFLKDLPSTNYTLIKSHYRTLGRILHPDKYQRYIRESPPPKSFPLLEPRRPFDPTDPMLQTPTTSPQKALDLITSAHVTLIDPSLRHTYEEECTGFIRRNAVPGSTKMKWRRAMENGWMDMYERERKGWGRKPWFWEYEYGLGSTGALIVAGGIGWRESFWIEFFPGFGKRWGYINMDVKGKKGDGGQMREGREKVDIDNMKIGGYGGDGKGVGIAETIVNVGHYYIDNYLPHLFSDWIWERCEDFRKWRGYGFDGHHEIDPQTSKRTWKGSHGEWLALREAEVAFYGSSTMREIYNLPTITARRKTVGEHCEGRIWWVWIPSSAGGSVSDLGIGRLAGSGVDSLQGRSLTELPWSQRFHNTDKQGINSYEVFDPDVMSLITALYIGVMGVWFIVFCTWGMRRMKRWWGGESKSRIGMEKEKEKEMKMMGGQVRTHSSESSGSDWRELFSSSDESTGGD
ncbi:hypothetical protein OCU04_001923 [Sclerotinia nivalis]|uniref:J domain-containing protein n=1 Tax=Sclerotinia nivalis TaxID=352851 RepID=A0A9X0AZ35_9HELO|nr:hypothetical protein OCU04_001923 [Sclerotinia nivalis]